MIGTLLLVAATAVVRLEIDADTPFVDGSTAYAVGVDGVRRPVVLVSPDEYMALTGRLSHVWASLHSTEQGRVSLHGTRVSQESDDVAHTKTTVYSDGYRFVEKAAPKTAAVRRTAANRREARPPFSAKAAKSPAISSRHRDFIEKRDRRLKKPVTVIHDAVTGKDKVIDE